MKNLPVILFFTLLSTNSTFGQTLFASLKGRVLDSTSHEPLPFVAVQLIQGEKTSYQSMTTIDGYFSFTNLTEGDYSIVFQNIGYIKTTPNNIHLSANQPVVLTDFYIQRSEAKLTLTRCAIPLLRLDDNPDETRISHDDIHHMPTRH